MNSKYNGLTFITVSFWTQFAFFSERHFQIILLRFCYSRIDFKGFFSGKLVVTVSLQLGKPRHGEMK